MVVGFGMVLVGFLVLGLIAMVALRSWGRNEAQTEARLRSPQTHKVAYVIPNGQDPSVVRAALAHAGFETVTDTAGGNERLLVACEESDRAQIRSIIEHVDRAGFDGPEMHVDHVRFDDER